jgi:Spy/CpxP family protein refolding chaperone
MKTKTITLAAAGLLTAATIGWAATSVGRTGDDVSAVLSGDTPEGGGFSLRARLARAMIAISPTDAQKHQVANILKAHREEVRAKLQPTMDAHKELHALATADTIDEQAIRASCKKLAALEEEMAVTRAKIRAEVQGVLTPDQRAKIAAMHAEAKPQIEARIKEHFGLLNAWIDKNATN